MGAGLLFPVLAVCLLPVGFAFSELATTLPFTSAVDVWASTAMGPRTGWATQWMFFLVQVVEPPLVAYIFVTVAGYFFDMPDAIRPLIAIVIMVIWFIVSNYRIRITGRMAVWLFLIMVSITLINSIYYFSSSQWELNNITEHGGLFPMGFMGALAGGAALVLKYIGFGMTPTLMQETKFPARKMVIVILSALFIPAIVYLIATFAVGGLAPHDVIAELTLPEPELVNSLGMLRIFGFSAIVAGLMYAFTTLMAFWASSARCLYGASQLNQLPPWFTKLNSHGQPYIANVVVLLFGIFFAIFTNTNWVQYVYSLSVVAAGVVYFMVCLSAFILRDKHPEWERPYRAPAGKPIFVIGMVVSAIITIIGVTLLPPNAWAPILIYIIIGALVPVGMRYYRKRSNGGYEPIILTPEDKDQIDTDL